jgi:hypothetical protein
MSIAPGQLPVYRSHPAEWTVPAVSATGAGNRLLQLLPESIPVSRKVLTNIADQFGYWVKSRFREMGAPTLEAPEGRRDEFIEPYFRTAKAKSGDGNPEGTRTGTDHDGHGSARENRWDSADGSALGHTVQFLRQRCRSA